MRAKSAVRAVVPLSRPRAVARVRVSRLAGETARRGFNSHRTRTDAPRQHSDKVMRDEDLAVQTRPHIDGIPVITREVARGPHPNPKLSDRIVPYTGISRVLLADEREVYECDECGFHRPRMRSVMGHLPSHSDKAVSLYSDAVLRSLVRTVKRAKRDRSRNYMERAAAELNESGVPTRHGQPWNASQVSALYIKHANRLRVRVSNEPERVTGATPTGAAGVTTRMRRTADTKLDARISQLAQRVGALGQRAGALALQLSSLEQELTALATDVTSAIARTTAGQEALEKARRWDEMRRLMS